jgi:hypothetical protein
MSFLSDLRMQNIFGGSQPMGMPNLSDTSQGYAKSIIDSIAPMIMNEQQKKRNFQAELENAQITHTPVGTVLNSQNGPMLSQIAAASSRPPTGSGPNGMNVVLGPQSNPGADILKQPDSPDIGKTPSAAAEIAKNKEGFEGLPGGDVVALDPTTGKVTKTGVSSGQLSDADKIARQQAGDINKINAQGQVNKDIETQKTNSATDIQNLKTQHDSAIKDLQTKHDTEMKNLKNQNAIDIQNLKNQAKTNGQSPNLPAIQDKARQALDTVNQLLTPEGKLNPNSQMAVGGSRMLGTQYIPGTAAKNTDATIKQLKNQLTLGVIQDMRNESKNGSTGFGRLTNKEVDLLQNSATKLDPSLDEGTFTAELGKIRDHLQKVIQNPAGPGLTTSSPLSPEELYKKYSQPAPVGQ